MKKRLLLFLIPILLFSGCTVSYKFNGASIDYTKVKTISILDFSNQATLVYGPLSQKFTECLKDMYSKQTKLRLVQRDGNLNIEGEIVGYDLTPMATQADGYASETRLTMTVNVRYSNSTKPEENFEERFSANRNFDASKMLESVQDELIEALDQEIAESIFNKTVANW
ncbi:MAG: LptE family protein [Bacteroidota bacterium]|nr:LptE family protein [Bacteroidota bacterium]